MVVSCERCGSQYRVREDKLPPSGGRIKCPSCSHIFIVRPSTADDAPEPPRFSMDPTENLAETVPPGARFDLTKKTSYPTMPATEAAPATATAEDSRAPSVDSMMLDDNRTWKLRLGGLTYAFHSRDSLQQWLIARDNLDEVKLSREGEAWRSLEQCPDLLTPQIKSKLGRSGVAEAASPPEKDATAAVPSSGPPTSPFDAVSGDDIARARANRAGAPPPSATAAARKTLAGLQAVSPPAASPAAGGSKRAARKAGGGGEARVEAKPPSNTLTLLISFVLLIAAVGALHAMQIINLGVLLPSLNNQTSSPVIMGGDTPTGQPQTTPESNLPPGENTPPIPPIAIIKDNALGNAIANLQEETPAQRTERVALERAQLPTLLASSERADWEKATKLIENSLLTESPDDMELYRSLAAAYQKLGDAERQATAQAKVDDFERRVAERAAQLVRWYEEAQQKLKTKRLGDAGEALRLSKLLLAEDPLSIPYHQLHVLSLTYLNQDAERAKAQVTLDGLILTEGQRTALAFIDQKQYDEAIDLIEKELLKRSPDNPDYLILAINAYTERNHKRDGKKIAHYQKLLEKTREGKTP
jgi:predicted Zn finger-like uncharacterized protein